MESPRFGAAVYARRLAAAAAATAEAGCGPGDQPRLRPALPHRVARAIRSSGSPRWCCRLPVIQRSWCRGWSWPRFGGRFFRNWAWRCVIGWTATIRTGWFVMRLGGAPAATAVTDSMPALHVLPLAGVLGVLPVLATDVLRGLRMVKEECEVDALRKAGSAIDRVHARVPEFLVPGRTEADVAADIAEAIVAEGHSEVAFIIVGSGPHGADPHHRYSDRELQAGDIVVVDIGGTYEPGYNSDSTRTYSIGEPGSMWRNSIRYCSGPSARR